MTTPSWKGLRRGLALCLPLILLASSARAQNDARAEEEVARYEKTLHGFDTPRAVAMSPGGRIWVADAGRHRVTAFGPDGERVVNLGGRGSAEGQLLDPRGLCVAGDGTLFVADTGNHRIQAFAPDGTFRRAIGGRGSAPGKFHTPVGLAADGERLLVCDTGNARVQVLSLDGAWRADLRPTSPFSRPIDVALSADGSIVVADAGLHRCLVFDAQGTERLRFGDVGYFPGLFSLMSGVDVRGDRIYVSDAENHRVQEFSMEGELLAKWGLHAIRPREGKGKLHYPSHFAVAPSGEFCALVEPFDDRVQVFGAGEEVVEGGDVFRRINTQPSPHYGQRAAAGGHWLVIAEPETHQLIVFDTQIEEPRMVSKVGGFGRRMGQFHGPDGIHVDGRDGSIVVTERAGGRLQTLRLRVDPEAEVGFDAEMACFVRMLDFERLGREVAGVELEWTVEPSAVTRDAAGRLFLLDARNERVHVFTPELTPVASFGGHGAGPGELRAPTDLELSPDGERIYVVDSLGQRVQVYSAAGEALFAFDGAPGERFDRPFGIAVAEDGTLFVTDAGSHRLLAFDPEGKPLWAAGGRGIQRGQLYKPRGVEVDGRGRVVVIDHGNHRAQVFSQRGEYLDCFGARLYTRPARLPHTYDPADYQE